MMDWETEKFIASVDYTNLSFKWENAICICVRDGITGKGFSWLTALKDTLESKDTAS